jgi:hypothetical protein
MVSTFKDMVVSGFTVTMVSGFTILSTRCLAKMEQARPRSNMNLNMDMYLIRILLLRYYFVFLFLFFDIIPAGFAATTSDFVVAGAGVITFVVSIGATAFVVSAMGFCSSVFSLHPMNANKTSTTKTPINFLIQPSFL